MINAIIFKVVAFFLSGVSCITIMLGDDFGYFIALLAIFFMLASINERVAK